MCAPRKITSFKCGTRRYRKTRAWMVSFSYVWSEAKLREPFWGRPLAELLPTYLRKVVFAPPKPGRGWLRVANAIIFLHIQTRTGKCPRMVMGHAGGSSAIAIGHAVQYWPNKYSCIGNLRGRENCGVSLLLRRCSSCSVGSPCYLICLRVCFLFKISWIAP